jgi:hypothetical protein
MTSSGAPDLLEGAANKEFWGNNDLLGAVANPTGGNFRAGVGRVGHAATIGGGGAGGPFGALVRATIPENTGSDRSSMERDIQSEQLAGMKTANAMGVHQWADETRPIEEKLKDVLAAGRTNLQLGNEQRLEGAKTDYQDDVYRSYERDRANTTEDFLNRYVRPQQAKAEGVVNAAGITAGGKLQGVQLQETSRLINGMLTNFARIATSPQYTAEDRAAAIENQRVIQELAQSMGIPIGGGLTALRGAAAGVR